jgi:hypothetical protein
MNRENTFFVIALAIESFLDDHLNDCASLKPYLWHQKTAEESYALATLILS